MYITIITLCCKRFMVGVNPGIEHTYNNTFTGERFTSNFTGPKLVSTNMLWANISL